MFQDRRGVPPRAWIRSNSGPHPAGPLLHDFEADGGPLWSLGTTRSKPTIPDFDQGAALVAFGTTTRTWEPGVFADVERDSWMMCMT